MTIDINRENSTLDTSRWVPRETQQLKNIHGPSRYNVMRKIYK